MHLKERVKERVKESNNVTYVGVDEFSDKHYYAVRDSNGVVVANVSVGKTTLCVEFTDWAFVSHVDRVMEEVFVSPINE